jgi:hypothetical protein
LEYAIRKVQENKVGLKLIRVHQLLVNAYNERLLEDNTYTTKKNNEALIDANRDVHLNVNIKKT